MTTLNDSNIGTSNIDEITNVETSNDSPAPSVLLSRKGLFGNSAACLSDNYPNTSNDCEMEVEETVNQENGDSNGNNISIQEENEQSIAIENKNENLESTSVIPDDEKTIEDSILDPTPIFKEAEDSEKVSSEEKTEPVPTVIGNEVEPTSESPLIEIDEPLPKDDENIGEKSDETENDEEIEIDSVEEVCVKKVISMDTEETVTGEEESEETPRKRAKRNAPKDSNDDDDFEEKTKELEVEENSLEGEKEVEVEEKEEIEIEQNDVEEEIEEEEKPKRTPRGRRSVKSQPSSSRSSRKKSEDSNAENAEQDVENPETESESKVETDEAPEETPKSSTRSSRRSNAVKSETDTPVPTRSSRRSTAAANVSTPEVKTTGRKSQVKKEEETESTPNQTRNQTPVETPSSTRGRRGRKPAEEKVSTPKSAIRTPSSKSRSAKNVSIIEAEDKNDESIEVEEKEEQEQKSAKKTPGRTPSYKKQPIKDSDEFDPYDLDTEMERHPEPLKNIHMEVQNFGTVKYAKIGKSVSNYESTERAAESRISNLSNTPPQRKERKSLAEMTPGKEKIQHRISMGSAKKRTKSTKKAFEDIGDEDEMDFETDSPKVEKSTKGRKRKADEESPSSVAVKKVAIELPNLSAEEQWQVDHPEDEHEPHAPGARVYALFGKVYYPAVIASERDGLGRFKVQYTSDKIVKDVPSAGIIPLRAVVAGKQCFYNEDVLNVIACPNAASAKEWTEGIFYLEALDENGDPTGDTIRADWCEISLDMSDWKEYINKKSSEATSIVADNITTPSQIYRAARKHVQTPAVKPKETAKKSTKNSSLPIEEQNNEFNLKKLIMNDVGVGKNIFQGKLFILTSSTRQNLKSVAQCMRKTELKEFVIENGGTVTEHFHDVDENPSLEAFLVSDRYYRTHKYLAALARGVPCISQEWIKQCANVGEIVDIEPFILSAGLSALDEKEYPPIKDHSSTLSGLKFYVHTTQRVREKTQLGPGSTFLQIWHPLIELLGGEYIDCEPEDFEKHGFDAVITDGNVDETVEEVASNKNIRILTSEFIIEAIITGKAPDLDEPKFTLDHLRKTKQEEKTTKKTKGRSH
ncbi:unnamed protein product [Caenorhabditis angaria]|uniref:BRCT domain-containing protein n=1 Tax=Caenorhabditis angaria TaxID=860376 RepID=A0A9P1I572_9PELO|nr:unnamed protein product [Caenorhabditis angaria]